MSSVSQRSASVNEPPQPAIYWEKIPRNMDELIGKLRTPRARSVWLRLNIACQAKARNGRISVTELMKAENCSESTIYRALREIKNAGLICALVTPGKTAVYYLPWNYAGTKPVPPPPAPLTLIQGRKRTPVTDDAATPVTDETALLKRTRDNVLLEKERKRVTTTDKAKPAADDWTEQMLRNIEKNGIAMNPEELLNLWR